MPVDLFQQNQIQVTGTPTQPPRDLLDESGTAPQMQGALREPALAGSSFLGGLAQLLGTPGDLKRFADAGMNATLGKALEPIFGPPPSAEQMAGLPSSSQLTSLGQKAGMLNRPDLQSQDTAEKYLAAGSRGLGSTLPLVALGGPTAVLRGILPGVLSGAGAQFGSDAAPNHPVAAPIIGGLAGGLTGAGLTGAVTKGAGALSGAKSPMLSAYDQAGVTPRLAGDVTGNPALRKVQAMAAKFPGGGKIEKAGEQTVKEFGSSIENTASQLGNSTSLQEAGSHLQTAARDWMETVAPQKHAAAWKPVNDAITPDAPVYLDNYRTALADISARNNRVSQLAANLGRPVVTAGQKASSPLPSTWQDAQTLRSDIGDIRGNPKLVEGIGAKDLTRLYAALSQDMRTAAKRMDIDAAVKSGVPRAQAAKGQLPLQQAFDNANKTSSDLYAFQGDVLGKILNSKNVAQNTIAPDRAATTILNSGKGGDFLLKRIRQEMPDAANELAAFKLRDMAKATASNNDSMRMAVSPSTFVTQLNRLSPEGRSALFDDPAVQRKIDALGKVADSIKKTAAELNTSKTAGHLGWAHALSGVLGAEGMTQGPLHALGAAAIPWAPGFVGARLTATPSLTRLLATPGGPSQLPLLPLMTLNSLPADSRRQLFSPDNTGQ